jgi:Ca2+-binding EF-hand superfamily protein
MMDKNGDNTISPDELLDVFSFNENFDIEMAREMIRQVDVN